MNDETDFMKSTCLLPIAWFLFLAAAHAAPPPGYQLTWSDEFNESKLDTNKWDYRTDSKMWSSQLPANVSVRDGKIFLAVKKEDASNSNGESTNSSQVSATPLVRPQISGAVLVGSQFQFQVSVTTGLNYTVQASTNMMTWTNLVTSSALASPFTWADKAATNCNQRFYRVQQGP